MLLLVVIKEKKMEGITTALTTALGSVSTNVMDAFGDVLPAALTIVGATLVVTLGVRMFKRIAR